MQVLTTVFCITHFTHHHALLHTPAVDVDFTLEDGPFIITPISPSSDCPALFIIQDSIVEPVESFTLSIEQANPGINVIPSNGEITVFIGKSVNCDPGYILFILTFYLLMQVSLVMKVTITAMEMLHVVLMEQVQQDSFASVILGLLEMALVV